MISRCEDMSKSYSSSQNGHFHAIRLVSELYQIICQRKGVSAVFSEVMPSSFVPKVFVKLQIDTIFNSDRLPEKPTIERDHLVVSVAFIQCSDISMVRVRFRHKHGCVLGPAAKARSCDSASIDGQTDICICSHLPEQVYRTSFPSLSP
jgi:hypothetical protein